MKLVKGEGALLVIVEKGEKLVETLTKELKTAGIQSGLISGLGALTDVELGYYRLHDKEYTRKTYRDEYELISLTGNVALKDGESFVHVHAMLGCHDFSTFGGHLFEGVVAVTGEVSIIPTSLKPIRRFDPELGLATICPF